MLQLKNHALTRRKRAQSASYALAENALRKVTFRTCNRPVVRDLMRQIMFLTVSVENRGRIEEVKALLTQMIEAQIADDSVNPRIERALETKHRQFDVGP